MGDVLVPVEGPGWADTSIIERPGIYPLRVETNVGRLVELLLPGIITTTTGARYFALHPLVWSHAESQGLDEDQARELLRRTEVVLAAAGHMHSLSSDHRRSVPDAHGESRIGTFMTEDGVDVTAAAELGPDGMSMGGFSGTYEAPERSIGLLDGRSPPRVGQRVEITPLSKGLEQALVLARKDWLTPQDLQSIGHLCPCEAAEAPDGQWLRKVMFEDARAGHPADISRRTTVLMMLEAIDPSIEDVELAFRLKHGFGAPLVPGTRESLTRCGWQAAILRNYSVGAWRSLWVWVSEQLSREAMTESQLSELLASELGTGRVDELHHGEGSRRNSDGTLIPLEEELRNNQIEPGPLTALRQLVLGSERLEDLGERACQEFVGTEQADLGPIWIQAQIKEHQSSSLGQLSRTLVRTLIDRAWRVAASKAQMQPEGPYWPTRLRERDDLIWMDGIEPGGEVSLRSWTLAQILGALGAVNRSDSGYEITPLGQELKRKIGSLEPTPLELDG